MNHAYQCLTQDNDWCALIMQKRSPQHNHHQHILLEQAVHESLERSIRIQWPTGRELLQPSFWKRVNAMGLFWDWLFSGCLSILTSLIQVFLLHATARLSPVNMTQQYPREKHTKIQMIGSLNELSHFIYFGSLGI